MASLGMLLLLLGQFLPQAWAQEGTTSNCPPLDCSIGVNNWKSGWSDTKKAYCCKHQGIACPDAPATTAVPTMPVCIVGFEDTWTPSQQEWCCTHLGLGCTTTTSCNYDCKVGLNNWQAGWAQSKIEWCCKHEGLACGSTTPAATTTLAPTTLAPTSTSCHFDCEVGLNNWKAGWAQAKIDWCCKHKGVACPPTTTVATTTLAPTTTSCHYDCQVGLNNWQAGWAQSKIKWCCKHEGIACTTTTVATTTTPAPTTTLAPTTTTLPTTTTPPPTTTSCHYDCKVGLNNWEAGWAQTKKNYCCKHEGLGCPTTTTKTTTTLAPTTTSCHYDCKVGLNDWKLGWAQPKKDWCCKHENIGCREAMTCHLACFGQGAYPVPLPGSVGSGGGAMLTDVTLKECSYACSTMAGCDGVMYTNQTQGSPFKTICYGKKNFHTSRCQPGGHTYVTSIFTDSKPWGKCAVFGDPHMLPFDRVYGPPVTMIDPGEYHLIKSGTLLIQGRFGYTQRFPTASSTLGIAVGGSLIKDHTLVMSYVGPETGYKGFKVFWDGEQILSSYPSQFSSDDGVLKATHGEMDPDKYHREGRHTIGGTHGLLPSYLFEFSADLNIYILIGPDNCNAIIETRKLSDDQDGYCGNWNCNAEDDSLHALEQRGLAAPMPTEDSLFKHGEPAPAWAMKKVDAPSLDDCDPTLKAKAIQMCAHLPFGERRECIFDACADKNLDAAAEDVGILGGTHAGGRAKKSDPSGQACNKVCEFEGSSATCTKRIAWLTAKTYTDRADACSEAHRLVLKQCKVCQDCSLEASGCRDRAPKMTFVGDRNVSVLQAYSRPAKIGAQLHAATAGRLVQVGSLGAGALVAAALAALGARFWRRSAEVAQSNAVRGEEASALIQ